MAAILSRGRWVIDLWGKVKEEMHTQYNSYSNSSMILAINPLHAKFFRGNKNIYLHFMSFLHIDMTQLKSSLK